MMNYPTASFFSRLSGQTVRCDLCPHHCAVAEGKTGICRVRKNVGGELKALTYGQVCSLHADPIEKKPLYHFFPGKQIYSVGSIGCNLRCTFCQNWEISQTGPDEFSFLQLASPEHIVENALAINDGIGIAYTYNEPAVWYEFMRDTATLANKRNLVNVMVTNGYINPDPLMEILPFMDAFSVDLKGFSDRFYATCTSSKLKPVLDTLLLLKQNGKHFEITNLVIPGENDDPDEFAAMVQWIAGSLGKDTVLHISRYFPMYEMTTEMTPVETIRQLYRIAKQSLPYVYIGNVIDSDGQHTFCSRCGEKVITRVRYHTEVTGLNKEGVCIHCGNSVIVRVFRGANT